MNAIGRKAARTVLLILATTLLGATSAHGEHVDGVVQAVWKEQQISFAYRTGGAAHTCAGLRTQLRALLVMLGVRETMMITVTGCEQDATMRVVHIALASPIEATPQSLVELTSRNATEQLAARLRGGQPPAAQTVPRFAAEWKTISFANALHLRLSPADCELLKQLRRELMPKLEVRMVKDRMRCSSDLASGYRPQLVVRALVAVPSRSLLAMHHHSL